MQTPTIDEKTLPVRFRPNHDRTVAAIMYLIEVAARDWESLDEKTIGRAVFIADDVHLGIYGRPVTYDNYVADADGPRGILVSELLAADVDGRRTPWKRIVTGGRAHYVQGSGSADLRKLSESDREQLRLALRIALGPEDEIAVRLNGHPAWIAAWKDRKAGIEPGHMDWMLFPDADQETIDNIRVATWWYQS